MNDLTWSVDADATHLAELVSFAHSMLKGKLKGPSREGVFGLPFRLTIAAESLPPGAMTCN